MNDLPQSRSAAKLIGLSHYFTGVPCKHGHVENRLVSTGACAQCMRERQRARLVNDPEYRQLHRKQTLAHKHRVLSDPERKAQIRQREKELQAKSPTRKAKKAAADKVRNQRDEVKDRARDRNRRAYHEKKHDPAFKAAQKVRSAQWATENRERCNAKTAGRRSKRKNATPHWLTAEQKDEIQRFYNLAQSLSESTGVSHEVDHIVPLTSQVVCGLHVPWNLQVLTTEENRRKANRLAGV